MPHHTSRPNFLRRGPATARAEKEKRISATEASRSFSRILDEVESGRRASEVLTYLRSRSPVVLDDRFGADLLDILAGDPTEERPTWDS